MLPDASAFDTSRQKYWEKRKKKKQDGGVFSISIWLLRSIQYIENSDIVQLHQHLQNGFNHLFHGAASVFRKHYTVRQVTL